MTAKAFDRKFGADLLPGLTTGAGIYLFRDAAGQVIYVGKAKNLRRRLQGYRNASRKRVHRKMRTLVREAASLEVRPLPSEEAALLEENTLIRTLRPAFNVDGAFAFLYPAVGLRADRRLTLLAFSTEPRTWDALGLSWYGVFRSRPRAKEGFDALVALLSLIGHREPHARMPEHPPRRGARLVGIRQLPQPTLTALDAFLAGRDRRLLALLSVELLGRSRALMQAAEVEQYLRLAELFFSQDCQRLHQTLTALQRTGTFVDQDERDALFIRARA